MYDDLSKKQADILNYIKSYIKYKGYPPAIREICTKLNISSTSTVHSHIVKLEDKGYIRRDPLKNRAIEIIDTDYDEMNSKKETFDVPIVGKVTAGEPILALENIEDTFPLPIELSTKGNLFILNVQGESMIEAGILDGDKIIVRQQKTANNGDIVVAMIDESATVKRYYKRNDHVELKPENSTMFPIIVKEVEILGKVIGLYRDI
ncbi:transcriptional repressor LexA [Miniphocaeibacter halophilus]|uniref:Transcriptional repressor LexA n=1 Tax=Miniphocaeibacter halophilus TaxID=2931922 RepID=A0AC61MPV7_9FIRM|nr:transcriptional repressor LexA [Miniphocaeibacter halophilus]QQK07611.1 transcriptional repressor LexA [Miniphocaeibacter halophilus]